MLEYVEIEGVLARTVGYCNYCKNRAKQQALQESGPRAPTPTI